jgi:DNA-binding IclR family transcriptional regulator
MLAAIKAQDGQTLRELAALTDMRVSTASQVLSTLQARGQAWCEEQEDGPWRWHLTELSKVVRPSKRRRF